MNNKTNTNRTCEMCGKQFVGHTTAKYCESCKLPAYKKQKAATQAKKRQKHKSGLRENLAAANRLGMTYGKYMARYVYADDYNL